MSTTIPIARRSATRQNLRRSALGSLAAAGAVTLALAGTASAADSSNTVALKKAGDTRLTLDKKAGAALKSLGIKVAPVKPSKVRRGAVVFPITSGSVDPKLTDGALINHSGGLRLTKGRTTVALRNFRIRVTDSQATISAAVGNSRATIINLDLAKAKVTRPALNLRVKKVGVKLNATGASALNKAFKTNAFKSGLKLGTAVVNARFAQFIVESGDTKLTLDSATLGAITGAGYTPAIVAPATLAGTVATFPIVKSKIAADLTIWRDRPLRRPVAHEVGYHDQRDGLRHQAVGQPDARGRHQRRAAQDRHPEPRYLQPKADPGRPDGDAARRRREGQHDAG